MRDTISDIGAENALFPPQYKKLFWEDRLTTVLAAATERVARGPVNPTFDADAFQAQLASFDFGSPREFGELLDWTINSLEKGVVHQTNPRYLGLFNPAPSFPSQCADRIAAAFNPQLASATTSPAAVAIEAHVAHAIASRAGLGAGATGHFTSGGSEANFTALICALTQASPDFAMTGARAFAGQPVFYVSADSHLAWIKIAHQAGIGRRAARLVPTDGTGRMSLPALADMIAADRAAGDVPVMIAATAGTTNAGMVDPLVGCAVAAAQHGVWFHVDAAWGGGAIASPKLLPALAGIEQADSVTIDAHKWFATTMGCGMFLTRYPAMLSAAFNVATSFMPSQAPSLDPYMTTAQWSRRFLGLRLFLSLASGGWAAHAAHVEHAVELTALLARNMERSGWSIVNTSPLAVACLVPPEGALPVRAIVDRVVASGRAWVSAATFAGQDVVRACVAHGETTPEDITAACHILDLAARSE